MRRLGGIGLVIVLVTSGCASRAADDRQARAQLVHRLEAAVSATARRQAAAGEFKGPVLGTRCRPRRGTGPDDLTSPGGRYRCFAATYRSKLSTIGQEYLALVNWRRGTFTFYRYRIPLFYGV